MRADSRGSATLALAGLLALLPAGAVRAQELEAPAVDFQTALHWAVGYSVNAPTQMMGFSTVVFGPGLRNWGLYVDYKRTMDSPADGAEYFPEITIGQAENLYNDRLSGEESVWTTVNVAVVRALTGTLALYAGAGFSKEKGFRQYFDQDQERGVYGYYWTDDEAASGDRVNLIGGVWLRATSHILFQFGVESAPRGFTVGGALVLPFFR